MAEAEGPQPRKGSMPPYIAFKTLTDVVDRMAEEGPPTRVDATYLDNYAGGYRPTVIGNLQSMGLLKKTLEPEQKLLDLVAATEPDRKALYAALFRDLYPDILSMALNSTQGEFLEAFASRGASGDTRRKAISFFLKGCNYAGIEVGKMWKTPPASTSGARKRTNNKDKDPGNGTPPPTPHNATGSGEIVTIDLGEAGEVVVRVDVKWLQLDNDTFTSLRQAVMDLKALAASTAAGSASKDSLDDSPTQDEGDE